MLSFKLIAIVSGVFAGLSVVALPMWALGVPGVEGNYMRGWKMGFQVIQIYPVTWLLNFAPYFALKNRLDEVTRGRWQTAVSVIALLLLLLGAARLFQAFKIMLDKSAP